MLIILGLLQIFLLYLDYYFHSIKIIFLLAVALLNFYVFILGMVASHNQNFILDFVKKRIFIVLAAAAGLSFFVFFVHVWVLEFIWKNVGTSLFQLTQGSIARQIWYDPIFFFLTAIFSFTIAYLVHKIPFIAKITG